MPETVTNYVVSEGREIVTIGGSSTPDVELKVTIRRRGALERDMGTQLLSDL